MKSYSDFYKIPAILQAGAGVIGMIGGKWMFHVPYVITSSIAGMMLMMAWKNNKKRIEKEALMENIRKNDTFYISYEELKAKAYREPKEEKTKDKTGLAKDKGELKNEDTYIYMGRGFPWENKHAQRMYEFSKLAELTPLIAGDADAQDNNRAIHGIGLNEEGDVLIPVKQATRHKMVVGTTGCGKTRFLELDAVQSILRHETTIIMDMKGDNDLVDRIHDVCEKEGRTFRFFSTAHPKHSQTYNPLENYAAPEHLASRIRSIMSEQTEDFYRDTIWWAVNTVVNGSLVNGEKITLKTIHKYIFDDEDLLIDKLKEQQKRCDDSAKAVAIERALSALKNFMDQPEEYRKKLLTNLQPLTMSMTNGGIGEILSPDVSDISFKKAASKGEVVYFYLPAMLDALVAKNVGKLVLQDLLFYIGSVYAYENTKHADPINVYVDEFYNCIFPSFVDFLNKSRGANSRITLYMQSEKDMEAVIAPAMSKQIMSNTNMKFIMETPEIEMATAMSDLCGNTIIQQSMDTKSITPDVKEDGSLYGANYGERRMPLDGYLIQPTLFTKLPQGQGFLLSKTVVPTKVRIPLLSDPITRSFITEVNDNYRKGI